MVHGTYGIARRDVQDMQEPNSFLETCPRGHSRPVRALLKHGANIQCATLHAEQRKWVSIAQKALNDPDANFTTR